MSNFALPPSYVVPSYSIVRKGLIKDRYVVDVGVYAFGMFEDVETSMGPSVKAFSVDSAIGCDLTLFGKS